MQFDLAAQGAESACLPIHGIEPVIAISKHVERPPFRRMMQVIARGLVITRAQRLATFDCVLETRLAGFEIDDIDLGIDASVGARYV